MTPKDSPDTPTPRERSQASEVASWAVFLSSAAVIVQPGYSWLRVAFFLSCAVSFVATIVRLKAAGLLRAAPGEIYRAKTRPKVTAIDFFGSVLCIIALYVM